MVGTFAQPLNRHRAGLGSAGVALPAALTGLLALSVLIAGAWLIVDLSAKAAKNREGAVRAFELAESGAAHALAILRGDLVDTSLTRLLVGSDNLQSTADDGRLIGYGLPAGDQVPAAGVSFAGGTYFVELVDDPGDTDGDPLADSNSRILARCRGVASDGASATVEAVIGSTPLPALATEGNLIINGNPEILGPCGSAHGNQIVVVSGNPTVSGGVTAADTVDVSGTITDTLGNPVEPLHHQPPIEIPELHYSDYCPGDADFVLRADGMVIDDLGNVVGDANGATVNGWKYVGSGIWDLDSDTPTPGTYCVEGNAKMGKNPGTAGSPIDLSVIAQGSIEISGNPYMQPDHADGILLLAEGDVSISGNPVASAKTYSGSIYAGSQCKVSGNPRISGSIMCKDNPNPPGSEEYAVQNEISGNAEITFDCTGLISGKRRFLSWSQQLGT